MKKTIPFILTALLFSLCLPARTVKETFTFAVKGTDTLYLDRIYDPSVAGEGLMPTMIYMYGGGFAYGNRGGNFSYLTDIGVQVISIEYRKLLAATGYAPVAPEVMDRAVDAALDDLTDAIAYSLSHAREFRIDTEKVMFSGSSAGAISTLMTIYDICNSGPLSKKFPQGFMPAGYIAYAGAIRNHEPALEWKKKPCPMMFFHGSEDTTLPVHSYITSDFSVFGPQYIVDQLKEMEVPYWLYIEDGADHVMSYKPFCGCNTEEIQTFVKKYVIQALPLQMETHERNMVSPSSLANPGIPMSRNTKVGN